MHLLIAIKMYLIKNKNNKFTLNCGGVRCRGVIGFLLGVDPKKYKENVIRMLDHHFKNC